MSTVSDLSLIKFLKRLTGIKSEIKVAQTSINDINVALKDNVEKQKILNQHLAKQNEQWRRIGLKSKPTLTLVK